MKKWEVELHLGSGADTDSLATYLVYAEDEGDAEDTALGNSRHLINATANLIRNPGAVDELDYDGVLVSEKAKGVVSEETIDREFYPPPPHLDEGGYELSDPKHPRHYDVYSDAADMREP